MSIESLSAESARNLVAQAEQTQAQAVKDAVALMFAKRREAATQAATTGQELYRELIKSVAFFAGLEKRETTAMPVCVWSHEERELGRFAVNFAVNLLKLDGYEVEAADEESSHEDYGPGGWQTYTRYEIRLRIRW